MPVKSCVTMLLDSTKVIAIVLGRAKVAFLSDTDPPELVVIMIKGSLRTS